MEAIVAISTPPGYGGIGIIRLSGKDSFKIIEKIFVPKNKEKIKGYNMKFGNIFDFKGKKIDEVLVTYFVSPKSFTTENMCEINSHGGPIVEKKILELCVEAGARMAEPGEFTKLAFLNGRIDLSQAEAIVDIINSKTQKEQEMSIKQLDGELSVKIKEIKDEIMKLMVDIEASIDYPEYDIEEVTRNKIKDVLLNTKGKLEILRKSFENGKIIKEGINMAIIGKPNAGKSSLLNALLNEERAIVTEIEGTTRDSIEEFITIEGIPVKVIDTAGIRNKTNDKIEEIGIRKAKRIAQKADLIVYIIDSLKGIDDEDFEILEEIKEKKVILILNKTDLISKENISKKIKNKYDIPIIKISAIKKEGINNLLKTISDIFKLGKIVIDDSFTITNERHKEIIIKSIDNENKAIESIDNNMPIDIATISIRQVLDELGKITGETATEDLINEIFKKFCLGK